MVKVVLTPGGVGRAATVVSTTAAGTDGILIGPANDLDNISNNWRYYLRSLVTSDFRQWRMERLLCTAI